MSSKAKTDRIAFARGLRENQTDAEMCLWQLLRARQVLGCKFRRQQPLGDFIVDFVCLEERLVIEVDGGQHVDNAYDERRSSWLHQEGFTVLRFWNDDVLLRTDAVLEAIVDVLEEGTPPP
ncbi:MAG: endonuclease domain-containing protein [Actinomycetota bacterium]